jgi:hypothetical protein
MKIPRYTRNRMHKPIKMQIKAEKKKLKQKLSDNGTPGSARW